MDPRDFIGGFVAVIAVVAIGGAALGIDTSHAIDELSKWFAAAMPGVIIGFIVTGIVAAITKELPPALLFGGATATVLTIVFRVMIWVDMHVPHS